MSMKTTAMAVKTKSAMDSSSSQRGAAQEVALPQPMAWLLTRRRQLTKRHRANIYIG